ncbi:hypothetical protein RJT34_27756 [Clitoria ternatea]|uniref:Uncharacterized protein n=1 Tax=Clitoria ternatea TaxID=43366 RepID=A0AAN9FA47_CLITE
MGETPRGNSKNKRFAAAAVDDGGGDVIECSGKYCRSCTAGMIADCVALCCCPCAVLHCFALAFVKAPWFVGRRCLGLGSKNKNKNKNKNKKKCHECVVGDVVVVENKVGWPKDNVAAAATTTSVCGSLGELDSVTVNAGFEAEKVWMELYQIGHLDFGRVSFSHDS